MMEPFQKGSFSYLSLPNWMQLDQNLVVGMTTREGGYSKGPYRSFNLGLHVNDHEKDVIKNREKLANNVMVPLQKWVFCEQVHGNSICKVTKQHRNSGVDNLETVIKGVDGLYTNDRETILATLYADCVPVYFFAPKHQMIGIVHAGWKGTVGNIVGNMVNRWVDVEQIPAKDIYAAIGPSISMEQYEVDEKVIANVDNVLDIHDTKPYTKTKVGKFLLNLKQLNRKLLIKAGVCESNILETSYCTSNNNDLFFSHRKENGVTGRMVSFIGYKL
ncbi:peptidoglycan editing factor PgeF [Anaerobacillus sp. MEB173]|uniref:peptidoglycan editing factor PgeF n=1 Tax=Anaerobacillus sp. MEB173 TaxID=3383345 RepID=UPI003F93B694